MPEIPPRALTIHDQSDMINQASLAHTENKNKKRMNTLFANKLANGCSLAFLLHTTYTYT